MQRLSLIDLRLHEVCLTEQPQATQLRVTPFCSNGRHLCNDLVIFLSSVSAGRQTSQPQAAARLYVSRLSIPLPINPISATSGTGRSLRQACPFHAKVFADLQLFLTTLWPQFLGPLSNLGHALEISYRALERLRIASAPKLLDPKPLLKHAVPQFIPVTRSGGIFLVVHRSSSSNRAATANQLLWLR